MRSMCGALPLTQIRDENVPHKCSQLRVFFHFVFREGLQNKTKHKKSQRKETTQEMSIIYLFAFALSAEKYARESLQYKRAY